MPAPLYARYVPPSKPKIIASPIAEPSISQVSPEEESKPRRDRPKKRKREIVQDTEVLDYEEDAKKHKSVLSKFERSSKLAEVARTNSTVAPEEEEKGAEDEPPRELHDLVPLPQPEPVPEAPYQPTFSTLPPWLAKPVTVPSSARTPFRDLNFDTRLLGLLEKKGYKDALAVQSAILPMLRPGLRQHLGDVCVSAATGSGKTLAYLLPMVEGLQGRTVTKLSGLIVVPTRELVTQARTVAEQLCVGTKLKIGTAVGNVPFASEQHLLVKRGSRYDPETSNALHEKANMQLRCGFFERGGIMDDLMDIPPGHVPQYESQVDILVCTPGRLVEHLQSTPGFHLRDVRWLVIDEADRLLDQSFQEWVTVLMDALESETPADQMSAREKLFIKRRWPREKALTKVVLSATMTKDLSKLGSLKFRRPKLVVVENEDSHSQQLPLDQPLNTDGDTFELPSTLREWAVPVGDGTDKPLYLLHLLQNRILQEAGMKSRKHSLSDERPDSDSEDATSSDSESSVSSVSTDPDSFSGEDLSDGDPIPTSHRPNVVVTQKAKNGETSTSRALIFTNNNENASRLSHLLSILHPPLKNSIETLTKSSATKAGKKILDAFSQGRLQVLVASDRASRGLDVPDLAHVINYDLPHSIHDYVHRVGRTARAGKEGQAWTLFTKSEARWFWKDIARGPSIKRGARKVERVTVDPDTVGDDERRKTYEASLKKLQLAVEGGTGRAVER